MAVVASGEIGLWVKRDKPPIPVSDLGGVAYRTCPLGSAACGYAGTEIFLRQDGTGIAEVTVNCASSACANSGPALQGGLDRLAALATSRLAQQAASGS